MIGIDIMVEEHKNILRLCAVVRSMCFEILKGKEVNYEDFQKVTDFVKNYADNHHHGKEEKLLFKKMQQQLGRIGENLITHGMLVEHDLGRLHMSELKAALQRVKEGDEESKLDVIANAISYTHLIERHIKKEDELIYPYSEKHLSKETLEEVDELTKSFEKEAEANGIQEKYTGILKELEQKYLG